MNKETDSQTIAKFMWENYEALREVGFDATQAGYLCGQILIAAQFVPVAENIKFLTASQVTIIGENLKKNS